MLSKKRFLICVFIFVFTATAWASFSPQRKLQKSPNVLFIILDSARADHFSCYGYKKNTTPRMDVIGRKGALFLNNFSPATNTFWSLPRIFFSRYFSLPIFERGYSWGVKRETPLSVFKKFDDQQIFLADILASNGYRTVFFHDFGAFSKETYLVGKFDEVYSFFGRARERAAEREIISGMTSWIHKNKERKFFIYCHIMSPHEPYPPKEEDGEFLAGVNPSAIECVKKRIYQAFQPGGDNTAGGWSLEDLEILRGFYDGNLKHTDKWVGVLYDKLEELGLQDKTIFIITSDHGENLGEHNRLEHGGPPWDSVTHVPLVMVYPPLIPPGVMVSGLTESIDIMPTILDICGIKIPRDKSMDGLSLLKFIKNPDKGKEAVFTNQSIRTEKHKYIVKKDLLYDLKKDPGEIRNIAKQKPLIKERLKTKFKQVMQPYKKRHASSKREKPPDFPFYFEIDRFKVAPEKAFERCADKRNNITVLKEASPKKSWLLNTCDGRRAGLFCLPASGPPPPITLSAPLPKGKYRVSMLLESPHKISLPPEKLGFRFRFNPQKPFALPGRINFVRKHGKAFYYYVDLGETELTKEKFSVRISFHPPDKGPYGICHIRFDPGGIRKEGITEIPDEEELRRRMENLKFHGYW